LVLDTEVEKSILLYFKILFPIRHFDYYIISKPNKNNKDLIKKINIKKINKPHYLKNNRKTCLNYYDEIEEYLKNNRIPNR